MRKSLTICEPKRPRYTVRDGLMGAGVMLVATLGFLFAGMVARRTGWLVTAEMLKGLAFPAALTISMPFWMLKGQSWKAQLALVGGLLIVLTAISYLATRI